MTRWPGRQLAMPEAIANFVTSPLGVPHPTACYAGGYRKFFIMADEEEPNQELQDVDNGNVAEPMLLEDDYSHLSAENQDISHAIHGFTPEQFCQIDEDNKEADDDNDDEDNDEANGNDEEDERSNQELFLQAKSMVELSERANKKQNKGDASKIWQFMKTVQFKDGIATDLQGIDSSAHAKLTKVESMGEYYCVCIVCYNDPEISLVDCMVKPTFKKGIVDGTGNLGKHMKSKHIDLWNEASKNVSYVYQGTPMSASRSDSVSDLQTGPTIKTPSPPKSLVYKQAKHKGDQYVLNKFHNLILQFGINKNIP
jgi:hypothetical protein